MCSSSLKAEHARWLRARRMASEFLMCSSRLKGEHAQWLRARRMMLLFVFWQAADHAQKTKLLQILRRCDVF